MQHGRRGRAAVARGAVPAIQLEELEPELELERRERVPLERADDDLVPPDFAVAPLLDLRVLRGLAALLRADEERVPPLDERDVLALRVPPLRDDDARVPLDRELLDFDVPPVDFDVPPLDERDTVLRAADVVLRAADVVLRAAAVVLRAAADDDDPLDARVRAALRAAVLRFAASFLRVAAAFWPAALRFAFSPPPVTRDSRSPASERRSSTAFARTDVSALAVAREIVRAALLRNPRARSRSKSSSCLLFFLAIRVLLFPRSARPSRGTQWVLIPCARSCV